ncbi:MAG: outer membrane beta-barrel protein [Saprospiraceae bacterium]|nr:outer membrane beta-barrel protein [Saprospiraceae bacterium]
MKKIIGIILVVWSIGIQLIAQKSPLWIGLVLGPQSTWIFNQDDFDRGGELDFTSSFGFSSGVELGYQIKGKSSLLSGVIYSTQGQNYITKNNPNADFKTNLSYLKIPLLYQWNSSGSSRWKFLLQTGFQLSLLLSAESSRLDKFGIYSPVTNDVKKDYSSSVIDFVFGIGLQYQWNKISIAALIRPDYSLNDIEKTGIKPSSRPQSQNFTVGLPQLVFRYYFAP